MSGTPLTNANGILNLVDGYATREDLDRILEDIEKSEHELSKMRQRAELLRKRLSHQEN